MAITTLPDGRHKVDVRIDGKRKRKTFYLHEEAVAYLDEIQRAEQKKRRAKVKDRRATTMRNMFELQLSQEDTTWTEKSKPRANAVLVLNDMDWWDVPVTEITEERLQAAWQKFRDNGNSEATVNRKKSAVNVLLRLAVRRGHIPKVPEGLSRKAELGGRISYLKEHEVEQLFEALDYLGEVQLYHFCNILLDTGARVSEALAVTPRDIYRGSVELNTLKGGEYRRIELTEHAEKGFKHMFDTNWGGVNQSRLNTFWNTKLRPFLRREDDTDFVPHILRHTCCTRLILGGMDLMKVKYWMGHKSVATTQRYIHMDENAARGGASILARR
jgi:integrase